MTTSGVSQSAALAQTHSRNFTAYTTILSVETRERNSARDAVHTFALIHVRKKCTSHCELPSLLRSHFRLLHFISTTCEFKFSSWLQQWPWRSTGRFQLIKKTWIHFLNRTNCNSVIDCLLLRFCHHLPAFRCQIVGVIHAQELCSNRMSSPLI